MKIREIINEDLTQSEIMTLRNYLTSVWVLPDKQDNQPNADTKPKPMPKVRIEFGSHFIDRLNLARNKSAKHPDGITMEMLTDLFELMIKPHLHSIYSMKTGQEATMKNKTTGICIPFVITAADDVEGSVHTIFLKSVIRSDLFGTKGTIFKVQNNKKNLPGTV
jgi:hypothetical protein